ADAAAEAKAVADAISKASGDLVLNGSGELGDNSYWPSMDFDATLGPVGTSGAFVGEGNRKHHQGDQLISINPSKTYRFSVKARELTDGVGSRMYGMLIPLDMSGFRILPQNYRFVEGTLTELAQDLNTGDTEIHLVSSEGWNNGHPPNERRPIFWDYVDATGRVWPPETYSRWDSSVVWDEGAINGNVITLNQPWPGPDFKAGARLSNGGGGGAYIYNPSNATLTSEWQEFANAITGVSDDGQTATMGRGFPPGTAAVNIGFIMDYQRDGVQ